MAPAAGPSTVIASLEGGAAPEPGTTTGAPLLPGVLADAIGPEEHLWVDLRWMRATGDIDRRDPRLTDAAAQILSALRGVPKDELVGEHLRRRRRTGDSPPPPSARCRACCWRPSCSRSWRSASATRR